MFAAGWFAEGEKNVQIKKQHKIDKGLFKEKCDMHIKHEADLHAMTWNGLRSILLSENKLKGNVFNMILFV